MEQVRDLLNKMRCARQVPKILSTLSVIPVILFVYRKVQKLELEWQLEECRTQTTH